MKAKLTGALFILCIPFMFVAYLVFDSFQNLKRKKHRNHLHRIGRATDYNPYCDKY